MEPIERMMANVPVEGVTTRWAHWPPQTESPYYSLFYGALAEYGVTPMPLKRNVHWVRAHQTDVVHFHWPETFWRRGTEGVRRRAAELKKLWDFLRAARRAGVRIVWTVHNIEAHEGGDLSDTIGHRLIATHADLLICHSEWAAKAVRKRYRTNAQVVVMPHGNFAGVFPQPRSAESVRAELGVSSRRPLVSCLGILRGYKGLEIACAAAERLGDDAHLLIAGAPHRDFDPSALRTAVNLLPHATFLDRRLTEQEFADFTASSDASLLPYTKVTSSGVLLSSWTLGTGVIASDLPPFCELLRDAGEAGRLFTSGDAGALADAIRSYVAIPRAARTTAALAQSDRYAWSKCVSLLLPYIERLSLAQTV